MQIYLSNAGQEPIYAQITRQIKQQILSGALRPGDALPSIRAVGEGAAHQRHHDQARV